MGLFTTATPPQEAQCRKKKSHYIRVKGENYGRRPKGTRSEGRGKGTRFPSIEIYSGGEALAQKRSYPDRAERKKDSGVRKKK